MVSFFSNLERTKEQLTIRFVITTIITVIYFSILILQYISYRNTRRFEKWSLIISRFFIEFVPMFCMIPLGNFIGQNINMMMNGLPLYSIIFFVFNLIYMACFLFAYYLYCYLFSSSVYISTAPTACWSGPFYFYSIVGISLFPLVVYIFLLFADWMIYILFAIKICFNVFVCSQTIYLPFVSSHANTLYAALFTAVCPLDILCLIQYIGYNVDNLYKVIVFIGSFIIAFLVWRGVTNGIVKKVVRNLGDVNLEDIEPSEDAMIDDLRINADRFSKILYLTDPKVRQYYMNLNLHKNQTKSELYLRIGLVNHCPMFLDWSLPRFTAEFHHNSRMVSMVTHLITFFPVESRLLNVFYNSLISKENLSISQRFIIYQVHKVKNLRQSSASSEITENLLSLKTMANNHILSVRNFWLNVPKDPSILYNIDKFTKHTCDIFKETLEKWPNNSRFCEEYSRYLIECATDFMQGLVIKNRAHLIEQGKNFVVDKCFRSLVRAYPAYLTRGIMDIKGNYIARKQMNNINTGNQSSNSSNSNNSTFSQSSEFQLDAEVEEQLGKANFNFHKLRLSFQRAFENRKSKNNRHLFLASFFALVLAICVCIFLYLFFYSFFDDRDSNMHDQLVLSRFRYGYDSAIMTLVMYYAYQNGIITEEQFGNETYGYAMIHPQNNKFNMKWTKNNHNLGDNHLNLPENRFCMIDEFQDWIEYSRDYLETLLSDIIDAAGQNQKGIYEEMEVMISSVVKVDFCDIINGTVSPINSPINQTLKTVITYFLLKMANHTQKKYHDAYNWHESVEICEILANSEIIFNVFDELTYDIAIQQASDRNSTIMILAIMLVCICVIYFILVESILIYCLRKTLQELSYLMKMMAQIDKTNRELAAQPFRNSSSEDLVGSFHDTSKMSIHPCMLYFTVVFYGIFSVIIFAAIIVVVGDKNAQFTNLNNWLYYGISRTNYFVESLAYTFMYILSVKYPHLNGIFNRNMAYSIAQGTLKQLIEYNNLVLRGSKADGSDPCRCYDNDLDNIHYADNCVNDVDASNSSDLHESYKCASLDAGIQFYNTFLSEILDEPQTITLDIGGTFYHAFHLVNVHLLDRSFEASTILSDSAHVAIESFHTYLSVILYGGMAVLIIVFVLFILNLRKLDRAFSGALQLIRRLPPMCVSTNAELLNYLLNKKPEKENSKMSTSKSIITNYHDSVICLNINKTVEVVNKSVTSLFGYTPEQLLGQSIECILSEENNPKVFEQMNLMKDGEAPLTFDISGKGISDDEQMVQVHITIIGISGDNSKNAKSYVVIMNDESGLINQQKIAEEAKAQSEQLLFQILPRDIVTRLNHGETDISFSVPSASVMFIDIVKFSDYSSTLTPAQIMENLSKVFACFDDAIAKYQLMIKIKLIGDVYMAAANLFTPNETVTKHACQCVQFGLDVLTVLDEVNSQLSSNLQVRIGVNTGGPLIAGVLGSDKPVFDIIGDTINVASRLQSTCIPGTVQISEDTYNAINNLNFSIEERGLIFLKGKGKRMAYIVRLNEHSSFFVSTFPETETNA
ncbi:Adenylate and Guanylate cyclase catalytic domain containing protein [Tritrichomonas foetus]|uniref:Adenylate and Guanylate cyclase catalytic domain containing protein n=1 Tax=Tritrichomonas foetus TaxID=1144522 RepID=A0A1J4JF00_9EUKA|nr:Adenylate and Guanylate cyclase catalytic domain containing protein [Tritrichomonas foetus]|eukprot:OHS96029.1 Adenylate and Guanylate cyclase catalytic domain containing protein [Tritrichomonas foetus]